MARFVVRLLSNQHNNSRSGRFWFVLSDICNPSAARMIVQKGRKKGCTLSRSELMICTPSLLAEGSRSRCCDAHPHILQDSFRLCDWCALSLRFREDDKLLSMSCCTCHTFYSRVTILAMPKAHKRVGHKKVSLICCSEVQLNTCHLIGPNNSICFALIVSNHLIQNFDLRVVSGQQ